MRLKRFCALSSSLKTVASVVSREPQLRERLVRRRTVAAYLVDVLSRISEHPASRVIALTPRVWKTRFSSNPMKSDLAMTQQ